VTLAGAFVPLVFGAFWQRATTQGALMATIGGLLSWILVEVMIGEDHSLIPPQLIGLGISMIGMIIGSLLPQWVGHRHPQAPGFLHEHAAHGHSQHQKL